MEDNDDTWKSMSPVFVSCAVIVLVCTTLIVYKIVRVMERRKLARASRRGSTDGGLVIKARTPAEGLSICMLKDELIQVQEQLVELMINSDLEAASPLMTRRTEIKEELARHAMKAALTVSAPWEAMLDSEKLCQDAAKLAGQLSRKRVLEVTEICTDIGEDARSDSDIGCSVSQAGSMSQTGSASQASKSKNGSRASNTLSSRGSTDHSSVALFLPSSHGSIAASVCSQGSIASTLGSGTK